MCHLRSSLLYLSSIISQFFSKVNYFDTTFQKYFQELE
uniref:Uncharacterized protein n=1 Tax=Phage sp. ctqZP6 TaxID=2828010 RepID=A0A8S5SHV3_9VIRU|nr:MAG TPA: hypothetical protein [Phage sp. ctqZP6]